MSLVEDFETTIKVIVVGNGGVGKSSMIRKFCTGEFTDTYGHENPPDTLDPKLPHIYLPNNGSRNPPPTLYANQNELHRNLRQRPFQRISAEEALSVPGTRRQLESTSWKRSSTSNPSDRCPIPYT